MIKKTFLLGTASLAILLAGCKTPVVFTTHSSIGMDVSGTAQMPNKVSLSYNRFEGAIVPRKANGEAHSVFGGMDADMTFFSGQTIKQTFATGKAAMLATGADLPSDEEFVSTVSGQDALVFVTATTFGLHLTAGEQQMSPNLLLGYRRTEAAMIPVPDPAQEVRSVYADILINSVADSSSSAITTNFSALRGVRIKQSFATGRAAEALATNSEVQQRLLQAAGLSASADLAKIRSEGQVLGEEVAKLVDTLPESKLDEAGQAALDVKLFKSSLGEFSKNTVPEKIRLLKAVSADRRSATEVEKVRQFKTKLAALQH